MVFNDLVVLKHAWVSQVFGFLVKFSSRVLSKVHECFVKNGLKTKLQTPRACTHTPNTLGVTMSYCFKMMGPPLDASSKLQLLLLAP